MRWIEERKRNEDMIKAMGECEMMCGATELRTTSEARGEDDQEENVRETEIVMEEYRRLRGRQ